MKTVTTPRKRKQQTPSIVSSWRKKIAIMAALLLTLGSFAGVLSIILYYKGKADNAEKRERIQASLAPLLYHARLNLGRANNEVRAKSADPEEIRELCEVVIETCRKVIDLDPDNEEAWRLRGRALEFKYRFKEAAESYTRAIELMPTSPAYQLRGLLGLRVIARTLPESAESDSLRTRAKNDLRQFVHHSQGDLSDQQNRFLSSFCIAWLLKENKNVHKAFSTTAILAPSEWLPPFLNGLAYFAENDPEKAVPLFLQASNLAPYISEIHAYHGRTLLLLRKSFEAKEAFNRALHADPGFFSVRFALAEILFAEGRYQEARKEFQNCLQLHPDSLPSLLQGAASGLRAWSPDQEEAAEMIAEILKELDHVLEAEPNQTEALYTRALAREAAGKREEALKDLNRLLALSPENREWLRQRAQIRTDLQNWDGAIEDLTTLGDMRERARVLSQAGKPDEALKDLNQLQEQDPRDASLYLLRASIELHADRWDGAIKTLDQLKKIEAHLPRADVLRAEAHLGKKNPDLAIRLVDKAFDADPLLAEALVVRGRAWLAKGRPDLAKADFREAVAIDSRVRKKIPTSQTP